MERNKKGFTLIELMVTITVVAVLSTIGIALYSQGQKFARDARRKSDLKQIETALNLYYEDTKHYPCEANFQLSSSTNKFWITDIASTGAGCGKNNANALLDTNYIGVLPSDPLKDNGTGDPRSAAYRGYAYSSASDCGKIPGSYYILVTQLENGSDGDSIGKKDFTWCNGNKLYATYGTGAGGSWAPTTYILASF